MIIRRLGIPPAEDHAGVFETTLLAALRPSLVQLDRLPTLDEVPVDPPQDGGWEHRHQPGHPLWGVMGADQRTGDLDSWLGTQVDRALPDAI